MKKTLILFAAILLGAQAAQAKDFYLTVTRDYSNHEAPVIELNYTAETPVMLRVFRPKNMKEFIASQMDLRRSWRQPAVEQNTARYLLQGFNSLKMDLDWLRLSVDSDLREKFKSRFEGGAFSKSASALPTGPTKLILGPDNFDLVREVSVESIGRDKAKPFDVPGFDWWADWYSSGIKTKQVKMPELESGFYLVQAIQGNSEGQVVLVVNDLRAELQQTDDHVLVRVSTREGKPAADHTVSLRNLQGKWISEGKTNKDGEAEFNGIKDSDLITLIQGAGGAAVIDSTFYSTVGEFPDVFLYTDRPMYRPQDQVFFKGILREYHDGLSRLMKSGKAKISLVDVENKPISDPVETDVNEYGTFNGGIKLPKSDSGVYRVLAQVDGSEHIGEFRVKQYVKPLFFVTITSPQETLRSGTTLQAHLQAKRYGGGVVSGAKVIAILYRVRAESNDWIDNGSLGESGTVENYGFTAKAPNSEVQVPELITQQDDLVLNSSGTVDIKMAVPKATGKEKNFDYKYQLKIAATDADGNDAYASQTFLDLKSEVSAHLHMTASFTTQDAPVTLNIRSVTPNGKVYPNAKGQLKWTRRGYRKPDQNLAPVAFETDAQGKFDVKVPSDAGGLMLAKVTLYDHSHNPATGESQVLIAGKPGEAVTDVEDLTLMTRKDVVHAGETAKLYVLLPDNWGEKGGNSGDIYVTVAGRKVYDHQVQHVTGLSTWIDAPIKSEYGNGVSVIVSYPDTERGWVERKLAYKIPDEEKNLTVKIQPENALVGSGGEQTLNVEIHDFAQKPVEAEFSISVIDKAVLDLQPQIRPSLLNFFYPDQRLNLMTFFSSDFQGYGYGQKIAQLFNGDRWHAASKSEQHAMDERDTAYWSPNLKTDASGKLAVKFRLPGNQTFWNVNIVAADKSGRFGEGEGQFEARLPVSFRLSMPAYLRERDQSIARFAFKNVVKQDVKVDYSFKPASVLTGNADEVKFSQNFPPKFEITKKLNLKLSSLDPSGEAHSQSDLILDKSNLGFIHDLRTLSGAVETPNYYKFDQDKPLTIPLSDKEKAGPLRVTVMTGLTGAVVPALSWLITYPYGCAEQLTSTTMPSLEIFQLFEPEAVVEPTAPTGFWAKLWFNVTQAFKKTQRWVASLFSHSTDLDNVRAFVEKARDNGRLGLAKLGALQNPDGGVKWWPGNAPSDVHMTIFVLSNILALKDLNQASTGGLAVNSAVNWLFAQDLPPRSPASMVVSYLKARASKLNAAYVDATAVLTALNFQADVALQDKNAFEQSYLLLAIKDFNFTEKEMNGNIAKLEKSVEDFLTQALSNGAELKAANWMPDVQEWNDYPGRFPSGIALAAEALHAWDKLSGDLKDKTVGFLMGQFNGDHFGSTYETSQVLVHASWILEEEIKNRGQVKASLTLNGQTLKADQGQIVSNIGGWTANVNEGLLKTGDNTLELKTGERNWVARARLSKRTPYEFTKPIQQGWALNKKFYLIDEKAGKLTELTGPTLKTKVGDLVFVELNSQALQDPKRWTSQYYVLSDETPAGFTVVEDDAYLRGSPYFLPVKISDLQIRKIEENRVNWYFKLTEVQSKDLGRLGYVMRANFAGDYNTGVARIEDFYDEAKFSLSPSVPMHVDEVDGPSH